MRRGGPVILAAALVAGGSPATAEEASTDVEVEVDDTGDGATLPVTNPVARWLLIGEASAALPVTSPQSDRFGVGGAPALAGYRSLSPWLLAGARLRFGALSNGEAPADMSLADPGAGGLASLTIAARFRPLGRADEAPRATGLWIELAAGAALTGTLVRPTVEAGLGWSLAAGSIDIGPALRYLRVQQLTDELDDRSANLALMGVELTWGDSRAVPPPPPPVVAAPPPEPAPVDTDGDGIFDDTDQCPTEPEDFDRFEDLDGCPDPDNDGDGILDEDDACPDHAEVVNGIDDQDGCPDEGVIVMIDDRIILEERVLFDTDRARVKHAARPILQAIVNLWKQHPEWEKMVIEGHTDHRGEADYNQKLSQLRAQRVREKLIEYGMPADKLHAIGYGETRPRDEGTTDEALQRNRRVEFVVVDKKKKTEGRRIPIEDLPRDAADTPDAGGLMAPGDDEEQK